jgi:predicted DNA-binding protein
MPPYVRPAKQIGLRLPPEMLAWLEAVAKAEDRSVPYIIKKILSARMAREAKPKKTKAAKS